MAQSDRSAGVASMLQMAARSSGVAANRFFDLFLEHTPAAIAVFDRDMRYLAATRRWYRDYGLEDTEIIGKTHYELFPNMPQWRRDRHAQCLAGEPFEADEERYTRPDGTIIWLRIEMVPWRDDRGDVGGLIIFSEVVTERKLLQDRLQAEMDRLKRSELIGKTGAWEWDVVDDALTCSDGVLNIFGTDVPERVRAESTIPLIHPDDAERVRNFMAEALEGLCPYDNEWRIIRPDGEIRYVRSVGEIERDEDGRPLRINGAMLDLTEMRETEQELRLRDLTIEQSPVSIIMSDLEGRLVYVNQAFLAATGGLTKDQLLGRFSRDFMGNPAQADSIAAELMRKGWWSDELVLTRKDGTPRDVQVSASLVYDQNNKPFRIVTTFLDITEQKAALERIEESERQLRQAQLIARLGIWHFDLKSMTFTVPEDSRRILGMDRTFAKFSADAARAVVHPEDRERIESDFGRVVAGKLKRSTGQYRLVPPEGRVIHIQVIASPEHDPSGVVIGLRGIVQDITSLKEMEAARNESERALLTLIANLPGVAYRCENNRDWTMRFVSEGAIRLFGYAAEDLIDNRVVSFGSLVHPDDTEVTWNAVQQAIAEKRGFQLNYRVRDREGRTKWVFELGTAVRDDKGDVVALEGYMADITERQEAILALEQREAQIRAIMNAAPIGIATSDGEGRVEIFNPAAEKIFGYTAQEMIEGKISVFDLYPAREKDRLLAGQRKFFGDNTHTYVGTGPHEFTARRRDGTEFPVQLAMTDYVAAGEHHFVGTILDITDLKKAEEELRQAQKLETVGQLTGGVAHDFNNLLMAMQINLELISDLLAGDPEGSELARITLGSVNRGAQLTRQLLAFSRRQPLAPKVVDPNELVKEFCVLISRAIGEQIDLRTQLAPGLWRTEVDPGQLENALLNLAVNARDAMPDGGTLLIETQNAPLSSDSPLGAEMPAPGDYVMIAVTDTGKGMSKEVQGKAFEPFFTTKDVGKGSGLGLSMVYGFVKQSGGHVLIYSEEGHGTSVKMYFPRVLTDVEEPEASVEPAARSGGGERILLVEDDPDVRLTINKLLKALNYEVSVASDGRQAVALIEDGLVPDLLLADVILPGGMTGRDVAEAVAQRVPSCRIVFMSGYTDTAIVSQGRLDKDVILLAKPFPREALAERIRTTLDS